VQIKSSLELSASSLLQVGAKRKSRLYVGGKDEGLRQELSGCPDMLIEAGQIVLTLGDVIIIKTEKLQFLDL